MKKSNLYTVGFTIAASCICALVLTFANAHCQGRIAVNENFDKIRSIVETFGLWTDRLGRAKVVDTYLNSVTATTKGEMTVYEARQQGELIGYGMELFGRGRYGQIKGILAVKPDLEHILAMKIYQQNETPGIGGAITSEQWLSQFSDVPLVTNGKPGVIISLTKEGPNVIDGITGATKTINSLNKIINKTIAQFLAGGTMLEELNLDLSVYDVTRVTPVYPENIEKPLHLQEDSRQSPFMIPTETVNLTPDKSVTSSMTNAPTFGQLTQIVDGVKKSGESDYIQLDSGLQWVQIDLEKAHALYAIVIWHYYKDPVIYNDVIVQVADDADFTENVRTLFNNDHDNTADFGKGDDKAYYARWWGQIVDAKGSEARYVRVYTNGGINGENTRFVEIAVYGKELK